MKTKLDLPPVPSRPAARGALALLLTGAVLGAQAGTPQATPPLPSPCAKTSPEASRWTHDDDKPVDACLGPNHYRIPANYFRDQIGPDFQGNFALMVQWPDLKPLPPGQRSAQSMETFYRQITISPDYLDRVPIDTRLAASLRSPWYRADHPAEHLHLRDEQPQQFGLTPYFVNPERFLVYKKHQERRDGYKSDIRLEQFQDWYLGRDAQGTLTTVIKCDSHLEPDAGVIQADPARTTLGPGPVCTQEIVIPENRLLISIDYRRVLLKEWKRFEDQARELLVRYRVR